MTVAVAEGLLPILLQVPVALIDRIILEFHVGQILALLFVLSVLAVLPLRSGKILSINLVAFGLIFVLTPFWVVEGYALMMFAGIALIFVGTMLFAFSGR